jgi:hypothetical protein
MISLQIASGMGLREEYKIKRKTRVKQRKKETNRIK